MRTNKAQTVFLGVVALSVITLLVSVFQKYLPFFLHSTIYYCQNVIRTLSTQSLPTPTSKLLLISFLLVIGFMGFRLIAIFTQSLKERKQFQHASPPHGELQRLARELTIERNVQVIKNHQPLAVCFGVFQPRIYISSGLLKLVSNEELYAILLHEKYHLDHKDNLVMFLATVVQHLLPFFPVVNDFIEHYRIQRELEADAIATNQNTESTHLISALEKLIKHEPQYAYVGASGLGVFDTLETRIRYLIYKTEYQPKFTIKNSLISLVSLFIFLALSWAPVQAIEFHDLGADAIMTCVSNSECATSCKGSINVSLQMSPIRTSFQNYVPASFASVSY